MEILTFSEAVSHFGVSLPTISRWVREGKLEEGPKAGKNKTVTKKSVDALSSDKAFQIGLEAIKRKKSKILKVSQEKDSQLENLETRIGELEDTIATMSEGLEKLEKVVQAHMEKTATELKNLRKVAESYVDKKFSERKEKRSSKARKGKT